MSNEIWFVVEHENGEPKRIALELATRARELAEELGGSAVGVALGPGARKVAGRVGEYGAQRVLASEDERFRQGSIGPLSQTLISLI